MSPLVTNKVKADTASPLQFANTLKKGVYQPSYLFMHGAKDCFVAPAQSEKLHKAIQAKAGATKSQYILLPNAGHGEGFDDAAQAQLIQFLNSALSK